MDPIQGISLSDVAKSAEQGARKLAEQHIASYVRGLMVDVHNLEAKALRLAEESRKAKEAADSRRAQLDRIMKGDWTAIEPFELAAAKA